MRPRRFRSRVVLAGLVVVLVALAILWLARAPVLAALGHLVVEERAPSRSDAIVVLTSNAVLGAVEAAELYRAAHAPRVVLVAVSPGVDEQILAKLDIGVPTATERAVLVLARLGVPREAIAVEATVDGTNRAVRTTARWARDARARRIIVVADRSHSRRIATLLRRQMAATAIVMRASRHDRFDPDRWWRERGMARELVMEGLRWVNSLVLGDLWANGASGGRAALTLRTAARCRPDGRSAATRCG